MASSPQVGFEAGIRTGAFILGANGVVLRRRNEPERPSYLGTAAKDALAVLERVITEGESEGCLLWPRAIDGVAIFHALAALGRMENCDRHGLHTLFFPWNRNTATTQRQLVVDRMQLVGATLPALNRAVQGHCSNPAFGYLMTLHSLKHLDTEKHKVWKKALEDDPSLGYPTLFEVMPQVGMIDSASSGYGDNLLRRLRRHTWIQERTEHLKAAADPARTPFFLCGVHADGAYEDLLRKAKRTYGAKDCEWRPDLILLDLTGRPRRTLQPWIQSTSNFLSAARNCYRDQCPPVLALTDDVFVLQTLRWNVLKQHDTERGRALAGSRPANSQLVLCGSPDLLNQRPVSPGSLGELRIEVYAAELLNFVEFGLELRRLLLESGSDDVAGSIATAIRVLQNLIGLPGSANKFQDFLAAEYSGPDLQHIAAGFDHLTPRGRIASAVKLGLAGSYHSLLSQFLETYDELCVLAYSDNPGSRLFRQCIAGLSQTGNKTVVVLASGLLRDFAELCISQDETFADVKSKLGSEIVLMDRKEAFEEIRVSEKEQRSIQQMVFIQPRSDDFLRVVTHHHLPEKMVVVSHLATADEMLRRVRALLQLHGVEPVKDNLVSVQEKIEKALHGHMIDLPDLDSVLTPPQVRTLDLTTISSGGAGATRIIGTSAGLIRAFDRSEVAVYDPDALQPFSRRLAQDLAQGDQVCIFGPDFMEEAREKLDLTADASEILALYHKSVAEAAAALPGKDLSKKAGALRERIVQADPSLESTLPGQRSIQEWIDVSELIDAPRDEVRPHAPADKRHYLTFMKALGIDDEVALHYWVWGVFWTRSARIKRGSDFHQVFMAILIDPHGTAARLPAKRDEIWRIYEAAERHLMTVTSNTTEGASNESR